MKNLIKAYCSDKSGNFAMMFAIATLPIMLSVGGAVDYSRFIKDRNKTQDAMDAAVLNAASQFNSLTNKEIRKQVKLAFKANLDSSIFDKLEKIKIEINRKSGIVRGTVQGKTETSFIMITGIKHLDYMANTEVKAGFGEQKLEIALVLDNTYSMSAGGKMAALKSTSTSFVETLFKANKKPENLKIALVPFNQYVNVGLHNRDADWIDVPEDNSETVPKQVKIEGSCKEVDSNWDGVAGTNEECEYEDSETETEERKYIWNGCVGSRQAPNNLKDGKYSDKIPGVLFRDIWAEGDCPNELRTLSNKKKEIITDLEAMDSNGLTYIPSGVMWGLRVLSSGKPYKQGAGADDVQKIMVLMTDGDNQSSMVDYGPYHWGKDIEHANEMTTASCNAAKADGVTIYSITFGASISAQTKSLIQNCASDPKLYFDAADGDGLENAFKSIVGDIGQLRISS